ncbi:hypothetical protein ACFR97_16985 [Haloplanus litoreus]|uniref:Uncharacterized protein n=1 Tax=Haloplanus litoreus TaxID=767515 RepID=A0ABD5ZXF4_9EURY
MPSKLSAVIFSQPSGRTHALVMFAGSLVFLGLYVYSGVIGDSSSSSWLVPMTIGTALSGIAESLPKDRRQTAGIFRVTAFLLLTGLLATTVFAPEFVVGE